MKKYVILGWCGGMGGGHLYTRNKCSAVRLAGWTPVVIHSRSSEVFLEELKPFQNNIVLDMDFLPCFYTRNQREEIINRMVEMVNPGLDDELFVESNGTRMSFWGELLARKMQCKHFSFLLESYFTWNDDHMDFFLHKLRRNELSVIRKDNLKSLFKNREDINYDDIPILHPCCANSVDDSTDMLGVEYSDYDIIIGHIGRTSKPYVESLGNEILRFVLQHPEKKILLLMIGGNKESDLAKQQSALFEDVNNMDYINTGYLYPIPQSLLSHLDIAIASCGCVTVAVRAGIKTIAYADNEYEPYGLVGYDLRKRNLKDNTRCGLSLSELLEEVLLGTYIERYEYVDLYKEAPSNERIMELLLTDLKYMTVVGEKVYYDTTRIYPNVFLYRLYIKTIGRVLSFKKILNLYLRSKSFIHKHSLVLH